MGTKLYFGGIPTDLDVKKLQEHWPENEMKPGDTYEYEEISGLLDVPVKSNRFRTITNRWRRVVEHAVGIIIGPSDGKCLKVLTESEKLGLSRSKLRTSSKLGRRSMTILARTDRKALSDAERAAYDHQKETSAKVISAAQLRKSIDMPAL